MTKRITCSACNGELKPYRGPRYNKKAGGFLIVAGAATSLFFIGPVLGIPLLLMGFYMTGAKRELLVCQDCNMAIERIELKPRKKEEANVPTQSALPIDQEKENHIKSLSEI